MNQTNIIDFVAYQKEPEAPQSNSSSNELVVAIQDLIQRLREGNSIQ
jgi:hypothetical protein